MARDKRAGQRLATVFERAVTASRGICLGLVERGLMTATAAEIEALGENIAVVSLVLALIRVRAASAQHPRDRGHVAGGLPSPDAGGAFSPGREPVPPRKAGSGVPREEAGRSGIPVTRRSSLTAFCERTADRETSSSTLDFASALTISSPTWRRRRCCARPSTAARRQSGVSPSPQGPCHCPGGSTYGNVFRFCHAHS